MCGYPTPLQVALSNVINLGVDTRNVTIGCCDGERPKLAALSQPGSEALLEYMSEPWMHAAVTAQRAAAPLEAPLPPVPYSARQLPRLQPTFGAFDTLDPFEANVMRSAVRRGKYNALEAGRERRARGSQAVQPRSRAASMLNTAGILSLGQDTGIFGNFMLDVLLEAITLSTSGGESRVAGVLALRIICKNCLYFSGLFVNRCFK